MARPASRPAPIGGSNKLLSVESAALYLDMPPARLRRYWRNFGLPARRVGRELRFRQRDLDSYIAALPVLNNTPRPGRDWQRVKTG